MKTILPLTAILTMTMAGCQPYYSKVGHRENPGQGAPVFSGVVQLAPDPNQTGNPPPVPPSAPEAKPAAGVR